MKNETKKALTLSNNLIEKLVDIKKTKGEIKATYKQSKYGKPTAILLFFSKVIGDENYTKKINEQKILKSWQEIIGETISNQAKPKKVQGEILYIQTTNNIIIKQIQISQKTILSKIHDKTGQNLAGIKFIQN